MCLCLSLALFRQLVDLFICLLAHAVVQHSLVIIWFLIGFICFQLQGELCTFASRRGMECMPLRTSSGAYHYHVNDQTKSLQVINGLFGIVVICLMMCTLKLWLKLCVSSVFSLSLSLSLFFYVPSELFWRFFSLNNIKLFISLSIVSAYLSSSPFVLSVSNQSKKQRKKLSEYWWSFKHTTQYLCGWRKCAATRQMICSCIVFSLRFISV